MHLPAGEAIDLSRLPPPHNRANAFFRRWAEVVLRFRYPLLALALALTAAMVYAAATRLRVDNSTEAFLAAEDESAVVLEDLRDHFGQDLLFQILVEGDVFTLPYLERLRALHEEVAALDMPLASLGQRTSARSGARPTSATQDPDLAGFGDEGWGEEGGGSIVDEVISLVNVRTTLWDDGLKVQGLLDTWPSAEDLPALARRVLDDRTLVGQVVGSEGKHSVLIVRTQFMNEADSGRVYERLVEIGKKHERPDFRVEVAGAPAVFVALNAHMMSDLGLTFTVANLFMLFVMWAIFRHPIGIASPLLVCVQAAICTLGALALCDRPMTMITNVLPSFLLCVGVGDSIHVQSVYRDARKRGFGNHASIVYAVGATGVPVFFTSLTTAIGLLSFRFAHLDAIQDMGTFGALGVMVALLNSLVLLPIALSWNRTSLLGVTAAERKRDLIDRMLSFCNDLSRPGQGGKTRGRIGVLVVGGAIALVSVVFALRVGVYHNPLRWFPEGDQTRAAVERLDDHVGGTASIALLLEAAPGKTLRNRETLLALEKLEKHVFGYRDASYPGPMITNATSLLDVVRESHRAVHEGDPARYALPPDERGVSDMLTLFENAGPSELSRLVTLDFTRSVMTVRARWLDAWAYRPLVAHIDEGIKKYFDEDVTVRTTGTVYSTVTLVGTLLGDLLRSFGAAFVIITIFMIVLLRDLKLGLISMVPNLLPIAAVMGCMGALGIPLDTNTLMVASIAIGIAVDDTIHFLHQFRSHMRAHGDVEAAIDHAFAHTGRAMVSTSIILVTGFMSLNVAYMSNVRAFGSLISLTVVFALFFDLIFSPALLRTFYRSTHEAAPRQKAAA